MMSEFGIEGLDTVALNDAPCTCPRSAFACHCQMTVLLPAHVQGCRDVSLIQLQARTRICQTYPKVTQHQRHQTRCHTLTSLHTQLDSIPVKYKNCNIVQAHKAPIARTVSKSYLQSICDMTISSHTSLRPCCARQWQACAQHESILLRMAFDIVRASLRCAAHIHCVRRLRAAQIGAVRSMTITERLSCVPEADSHIARSTAQWKPDNYVWHGSVSAILCQAVLWQPQGRA